MGKTFIIVSDKDKVKDLLDHLYQTVRILGGGVGHPRKSPQGWQREVSCFQKTFREWDWRDPLLQWDGVAVQGQGGGAEQ